MSMRTYNNSLAADLLCAKMFRLLDGDRNNPAGFKATNFKLIPTVTMRGKGRMLAFSGLFIDDQNTAMPFTISFSETLRHGKFAILRQFGCGGIRANRSRVLSFLSVIDYLEYVGLLDSGSLKKHIDSLITPCAAKGRVDAVADYPEFCRKAIQSLPYDDAVALTGEAKAA